jgi:3-hydroxyacyl-CoA dehydrogenase/enoyl-CoA hydratase/3-hydroxybutyryl-CoA epimerase/enoyl-CoA isomerase
MIYQGKTLCVNFIDNRDGIAKLTFDRENDAINKFDQLTLNELRAAVEAIKITDGIHGLMINSNKDAFIVGADITEFQSLFKNEEALLAAEVYKLHEIFNGIEDLPYPTVTAINGLALGGGFEVCLTTDFRVLASNAQLGFPEVKLGIIPGYGGTVRTPRIIGVDNAVEWIATGNQFKADKALTVGIVDAVVTDNDLETASLDLLDKAIAGDFDIQAIRAQKTGPLALNDIEMIMAFTTCKAMVAQQAGKFFKAPMASVKTMEKHAKLKRNDALKVESENIAKLAKTEIADNLVGLFLNDQALTKKAKQFAQGSTPVKHAAVLGAGIMGGGIAYQSAYKGTPIRMKDIAQAGLDAGLNEANTLLSKRVSRGRMSPQKMGETLNNISATLNFDNFDAIDIVVEAVVENPKIKAMALAEVEQQVSDETIIASNTSTIPITELAKSLKRPENFCGMHFFNPVPKMPLVEVIRGEQSSEQAIARTVSYALAMGKKPVVVNDCPGFLVNRILFAYLNGFVELLRDGADYKAIDKAAVKFGWPMGPAHLCDVVGIDTGVHAGAVMAEGFPERMGKDYTTALEVLLENNRLGEKNNLGFYRYEADKRGRMQKVIDTELDKLLEPVTAKARSFSDEEIMDRLMIPFCFEAVRCLEEKIGSCAEDIDMALLYGIGFPLHRGGALRHMQNIGLKSFCDNAETYAPLGAMYQPSEGLKSMANNHQSLFDQQ